MEPRQYLLALATALILCTAEVRSAWSYDESHAPASAALSRREYYTQPMGYSVWKTPPASAQEFAELIEQRRLNATPEQFAQSLHDAGWIPDARPATALAFVRSLHQQSIAETKLLRLGRILRSYRTGEGVLDDGFYQVVKAGESGYFNAAGSFVVRVLCLNVVYPEQVPTAEPSPSPSASTGSTPAPTPGNPDTEQPNAPPNSQFYAPLPFPPPAREIQEPASPSAP
jgi:hypothetical protein